MLAAYLSFLQGLLVVCLLPFVPPAAATADGQGGSSRLAQALVFVNLFGASLCVCLLSTIVRGCSGQS